MTNNYLHFDSDIVEAVYNNFGGKYTKKQIEDVFNCSVSYLHHLLTHTEAISVYVNKIGYFHTSEKDLIKRKHFLEDKAARRGVVSKKILNELKMIDHKMKILSSPMYDGSPVHTDLRECMRRSPKNKKSWDYVQDYQNKMKF